MVSHRGNFPCWKGRVPRDLLNLSSLAYTRAMECKGRDNAITPQQLLEVAMVPLRLVGGLGRLLAEVGGVCGDLLVITGNPEVSQGEISRLARETDRLYRGDTPLGQIVVAAGFDGLSAGIRAKQDTPPTANVIIITWAQLFDEVEQLAAKLGRPCASPVFSGMTPSDNFLSNLGYSKRPERFVAGSYEPNTLPSNPSKQEVDAYQRRSGVNRPRHTSN